MRISYTPGRPAPYSDPRHRIKAGPIRDGESRPEDEAMTIIELTGGDLGVETVLVRCNLAEASAPVEVDYRTDGGEGFVGTQYQCADCQHTTAGLIAIGKRLAASAVEVPEEEFDCDSEILPSLALNADTDHEDARDWYESYG